MIKWIADNWALIILLVVVLTELIITIVKFSEKPTDEKIAMFKEWLLFAVAEAEKELGSGTGMLKLRWVYDKALAKFPMIATALPFEKFCEYVDEALEKFKEVLSSNEQIQKYIGEDAKA